MDAEPGRAPIEALLSETAWLRRLAASLTSDAASADDLVQETWVAALERPPSAERALRPWLAEVARNFARMRWRSDSARQRREAGREKGEAETSPGVLVERVETQRWLASEVLALDEPFRSTLALRYYEGLSGAEIARRLDVPAGTVRWRLKRGLDLLRERLDRRHGGDRARWRALLLPLAAQRPAIPLGAIGAAAALVVATVAGAAWLRSARVERGSAAAVADIAGERAGGAGVPEPARRAVEPGAASIPRRTATVRARAVDEGGNPIAGALLVLRDGAATSGANADGAIALALDRDLVRDGEGAEFALHAVGFVPERLRARVVAGRDTHLGEIVLERAGELTGLVTDELGRPIGGARVLAEIAGSRWLGVAEPPLEEARHLGSLLGAEAPRTRTDAGGRYRFEALPQRFVRVWASAAGRETDCSAPVAVHAGAEAVAPNLALAEPPPSAHIAGVVRAAGGAPLAFAEVECARASLQRQFFRSEFGVHSTRADESGRFELAVGPNAAYRVAARDLERRFAPLVIGPIAAGENGVEIELDAWREIEVAARGPAGESLAAFDVELADAAGRTLDPALFAARAGTIRVPHVPFLVRARAGGLAEVERGPFEPSEAPPRLDFDLSRPEQLSVAVRHGSRGVAGARVACLPVLAGGRARETADLVRDTPPIATRVARSGMAATGRSDGRGIASLSVRERGLFLIRVEAAGFAPALVGPLELDPRAAREIVCPLTQGGELTGRVVRADGRDAAGAIVAVTNGDGFVRTQRAGTEGEFQFDRLAPGAWQVRLAREETEREPWQSIDELGVERWERCAFAGDVEVEEGATSRFDLRPLAHAATRLEGRLAFDGAAPGPWQVALSPTGVSGTRSERFAALDPTGTFEVDALRPGRYSLSAFSVGRERVRVGLELGEVDLAPGHNAWSLEIAPAALALELNGLSPVDTVVCTIEDEAGRRMRIEIDPPVLGAYELTGLIPGQARVAIERGADSETVARLGLTAGRRGRVMH